MIEGTAIRQLFLGATLTSVLLCGGRPALADQSNHAIERVNDPEEKRGDGDGVYGRFDGDLSFRIATGLELDLSIPAPRPLLVGSLVAYQTLGVYASARKSIIKKDPERLVTSIGASISPLFLLRWGMNAASGRAFWDLTLDSLALNLGLQLSLPPGGTYGEDVGFEGGLEVGVPLMAKAEGLWLRTRVNLLTGYDSPIGTLWLTIGWEGYFYAGILPTD